MTADIQSKQATTDGHPTEASVLSLSQPAAQAWLAEHGIAKLLQQLVGAALAEHPDDIVAWMQEQLAKPSSGAWYVLHGFLAGDMHHVLACRLSQQHPSHHSTTPRPGTTGTQMMT